MRRAARAAPCAWVLLAALGVGGCGGPGAPAPFAVRDSAGVRIAENAGIPAWETGAGWRLSPEPLVEIGAGEDPPGGALYQVFAATRLGDGSIVVANTGTQELRVYTQAGAFVRAIGSEGEGPGRFRGLAWVGSAAGDTVVAWDWQLHRITRFTSGGELLDTEQVRVPDSAILPRAIGLFSSGDFVFNSGSAIPPHRAQVARAPVAYYRLPVGGSTPVPIGAFAGLEQVRAGGGGGRGGTMVLQRVLLGRDTYVAVHGERVYVADSERFEIRRLAPDGTLLEIVRMEHRPVRVTPEDERFFREERLARRAGGPGLPGAVPLDEPPVSEVMPAFTGVWVDRPGNVWVRPPRSARASNPPWLVFDPEGRALGPVEMPDRFTPMEIGADYVLGLWRDSLDVERVRLYGLSR